MQNLKHFFALALVLAAPLLFTTACKDDDDDTNTVQPTLYDKLGKVEGISAVVDQFLVNVVTETSTPTSKLKRTFQPLLTEVGTRDPFTVPRVILLRNNLIDQIGAAAGGPLTYKGKTMQQAHDGMAITDEEFTALVTALDQALDTKMVPAADQTTLLNVLAGLKSQIVNQ